MGCGWLGNRRSALQVKAMPGLAPIRRLSRLFLVVPFAFDTRDNQTGHANCN
jgi:hypothetical protein